jgi:hypothetical protein
MRDLELLDALLYDTIVEQEGAAFAASYRKMIDSPTLLDGASREDAARLVSAVAPHASPACAIYNGASGTSTTVRPAPLRSARFQRLPLSRRLVRTT